MRLASLFTLTLALFAPADPGASASPAYPKAKAVALIVPYPAGGPSDAAARPFSVPFAAALQQHVVVENVGGASGAIGAKKLLMAPADGYQLFFGSPNEVMLAPLLNARAGFKPEDFSLVHPISTAALVLVVRKELPARSPDEFIALARQQSAAGKPLSYGSVGVGSLFHLITEYMGRKTGARFTHAPYKGSAPVLQDLAGSQVDFAVLPYQATMDKLLGDGRIRLVAVLSSKIPIKLQGYPTLARSKELKGFDFSIWGGIFVKRGTPDAALEPIRRAVVQAVAEPRFNERIQSEGGIPFQPLGTAQVEEMQRQQIKAYRSMIKLLALEGTVAD